MIDKEFVREKINLITRGLEYLEDFRDMTFSEAAGDFIKYSALKNILMEVIGRAIDVNEHIIVEKSDSRREVPKTYRETFLILGELGVFPEDFSLQISRSAGFRNAIVHEYNNLDKGIVYSTVAQAVDQYKNYCQYILGFLEKI